MDSFMFAFHSSMLWTVFAILCSADEEQFVMGKVFEEQHMDTV